MADHHKSSAQLEREIDARRLRIENRVDELTARLSPGQLIDEALRMGRNGPAADFANNLGRSVVNNPVPVALIGASLAWLFVKPEGTPSSRPRPHTDGVDHDGSAPGLGRDELGEEYPVAAIRGTYMRRVSVEPADNGHSHSSFTDDAGRKFKALTDATGNRAGHFRDESGRFFRGFISDTGHRVTDFRDEADNRLHQASGWASHTWERAQHSAGRLGSGLRQGGRNIGHHANNAGGNLLAGGGQAVDAVDDFIHRQPLVSGAIAFAIGAVIAGTLPHTRQEDEAFGDTADAVRQRATDEAGKAYEQGRGQAQALHDKARETVGELHDKARDAVSQGHDAARAEAEKLTRH